MTYKVQIDDTVRNATADETANIDAIRAETQAIAAAADAKAAALVSARTKLAGLGLTTDEINALLGV
jgi:hypothetical protein